MSEATQVEVRAPSSETEGVLNALTFEEVQAMVDVAETPRDRLLFLMLWATAGRLSEVLDLKLMDLRPPDSIILLNEKQHKVKPGEHRPLEHKRIYVPAEVLDQVVTYSASDSLSRSAFVFRGRDRVSRLSRTTAWRVVKRAATLAGVERERDTPTMGHRTTAAWAHLFRHGSAVWMLENGYTLGSIQGHLGHKNIQTTGIYARVSDQARRAQTTHIELPGMN